jgi:hypothetical protein
VNIDAQPVHSILGATDEHSQRIIVRKSKTDRLALC